MSDELAERQPPPIAVSTSATRPEAVVRSLASEIGARPAGSAAELRAAATVAAAFEKIGVAAVQLPVRVRAPGSWEALCYGPLGLLAVLVALMQPYAGLALALLTSMACGVEVSGRPLLTRLVPRRAGRTVLAIVPPTRQEIRRLVVMANIDTPFSSSATSYSVFDGGWRSGALMVAGLATTVALLGARLFLGGSAATALALAASVFPLVWLMCVGWLDWRAVGSPGAITNASGVAALVALAAHARLQPATWVETWFLATSAGEARGDGLRVFLDANQFEADATYFVQLQSVGAGELAVAAREGAFATRAASPLLARLIAEVGADRPTLAAKLLPALHRATQTGVALRAGYDAITLVGVNERGVIPLDGNQRDTVEAVSAAQIQRTVGLLIGALARLDAEAAERNRLTLLARASAAGLVEQPPPSGE